MRWIFDRSIRFSTSVIIFFSLVHYFLFIGLTNCCGENSSSSW
jgi:hypothetical protein